MRKRPPILSVDRVRALDRRATAQFGIPSLLLMENAGRSVADVIEQKLPRAFRSAPVWVICGGGNNGGDGFVIARHLFQKHRTVSIFLASQPNKFKGDAALNYRIIRNIGIRIKPISQLKKVSSGLRSRSKVVIVDALLGTGFKGPLRDSAQKAIRQINEQKMAGKKNVRVIAVDIPSGLDGDHGLIGEAVRADVTVTFASLKPGLIQKNVGPYVGRIQVVDIGIPKKLMVGG